MPSDPKKDMNVIEIEVFNKLFASIAEEMGIILARSSFSSNIKERRDFSCALFDARGDLAAQASHIPVHLGSMPSTLEHVLRRFSLEPGDIIITNDPFKGGSHLPDITLIEAVFSQDGSGPLFYVANRAHHADVGGRTPGSMGMHASIHDEGVLIPPTYFAKKGEIDSSFLDSFLERVRNPEERLGDLQAQTASLRRGKTRLLELEKKHGADRLSTVIVQLQRYAESLMRRAVETLPDGVYTHADYLDNDGISRKPIPIRVRVTITGGEAIVDFRESGDQAATPLNAVPSVVFSVVVYVFQCLLGDRYPINSGSYRPLRILTRPGSILDAAFPAPVAAGNVETSQRVVDVLLGALSHAAPALIPAASCGSMNNIAIGRSGGDGKKEFTYYETIGGGMGARPWSDGLSGVHTHMTNTLNTPIEVLEHLYPIRIETYGLRNHSGGEGQWKGGDGIVRAYRFLEEAHLSLLTERRSLPPHGLAGGGNGRKGENMLLRRDGSRKRLGGKTNLDVLPGDRLVVKTPGGGGWGEG